MTAQGICCFEFANCSIRVFDPVVALSMFDKARTLVPSTHVPPPAVIRLNDLISSPVDRFADDGLKFERPTVSSPVDHLDITGCANFIGMHSPDQSAEAAARFSENEGFKDDFINWGNKLVKKVKKGVNGFADDRPITTENRLMRLSAVVKKFARRARRRSWLRKRVRFQRYYTRHYHWC